MNNQCDRCNRKANTLTGSWFNTQMICEQCDYLEHCHPLIVKAKERERQELSNGNYNFKGIGLPKDLKEISRIADNMEIPQSKRFLKPLTKAEIKEQATFIFPPKE